LQAEGKVIHSIALPSMGAASFAAGETKSLPIRLRHWIGRIESAAPVVLEKRE
jgi:hypothetical protein